MTQDLNPKEIERKAFRYDAQDGFLEFLAGTFFFFVARAIIDPHLAWVPALLVFPMRWAMKFFKEKFTYPRIGYVKLRSEKASEFGWGVLRYLGVVILGVGVWLWLSGQISSWGQWMKWLPLMIGLFCSGAFSYLATKGGLWRHYVLMGACAGWGLFCTRYGGIVGVQRWALGMGLLCLVMGVAVFLRFVKTHPVRETEVADEPS